MFGSVVTRVTSLRAIEPRVVNLDVWRAHYKPMREQEFNQDGGYPVVERKPPAVILQNRESSIESAVREFCKANEIGKQHAAECVHEALKHFRKGRSGASSVSAGIDKAREFMPRDMPQGAA